jgi:asparagine synthase (glutamine-hydrolysing)
MCGIVGFNWPDQHLVKTMMDAVRHRGPDDEGSFVNEDVSLGHRRLSIVDLSALGRQPMDYGHGGRLVTVTFNGEIFNYRELRPALEAKGHRFKSETDTEIILASYVEWGPECVQRFNGMWAFALYDVAARQLFLSRDRFGEKPLHYRHNAGKLIFASEIKAILAHPVPRRANREVVSDYLYKGEANGKLDSFFEDIRMLPPAHNAVLDLRTGALTLKKYYEPRRDSRHVTPDEFRATLQKAVERRLIADVPISISLSSGTDSTSVAALTARLTDAGIKAFTTTSDQGVGDESALITHFLQRYPQFELEKSDLSEASFCEHYREIIYHMDEPFARQSAYVRWEIARLTRGHHRKVLLNGEGADEVLGGYASFAPRFIADLLKRGRLISFVREVASTMSHPERGRIMSEFRAMTAMRGTNRAQADAKATAFRRKYEISLDRVESRPRKHADMKDFLHALIHEYSLPRLLVCNDKMAMANSVEGRAPFLDHEFVDLIFSMDISKLLVKGWRKFPLRAAMQGLVPDEILFRKSKDAFNAPIFEYLRSESIQRRVKEIFQEPRTAGVFSPRAYLAEYDCLLSRRAADRPFLLHGLFLEEWARMFEVDFA